MGGSNLFPNRRICDQKRMPEARNSLPTRTRVAGAAHNLGLASRGGLEGLGIRGAGQSPEFLRGHAAHGFSDRALAAGFLAAVPNSTG